MNFSIHRQTYIDIHLPSKVRILSLILHSLCLVQIGSRSSVYSPESNVRKTGSYIYEEFMPTDGTDVKVLHLFLLHLSPSVGLSLPPPLCADQGERERQGQGPSLDMLAK